MGLRGSEVDGRGELGCNGATMKKMLAATVALLIALGSPSWAWAGFDEGSAAYKRGD